MLLTLFTSSFPAFQYDVIIDRIPAELLTFVYMSCINYLCHFFYFILILFLIWTVCEIVSFSYRFHGEQQKKKKNSKINYEQ